jgi:hypothetical protein
MTRAPFLAAAACIFAQFAHGQGCIIARSNGEVGGPASEGGYLTPGEFSFGIGYRHQFSFRHFVGSVEQKQRIALGTQIENKINLENLSVTYQATRRFSFSADLPILSASRRANNSPYSTLAAGVGDMAFMANGWLWNPAENKRGNIQLGAGLVIPTGRNNVTTTVDAFDGKGLRPVLDDYSIQPGTGGYGIVMQWVAYKNVKSSQLYFNGNYLATPDNTNSVLRSTSATANPNTAYNSISDQYLIQAGVAMPVSKVPGLTATFGPRMEGVPARDLIGESLGFRRPGYAISLEPGVQYYRGRSVFTASIGRAIYRNRTRSVPDILSGGHGDAAFADWVWLASYTFRWKPGHSNMAGGHS